MVFAIPECQRLEAAKKKVFDFLFTCLPLAVQWVDEKQQNILASGRILTPDEIAIARAVGVRRPQRIRLQTVPTIAPPQDATFAAAAAQAGYVLEQHDGHDFVLWNFPSRRSL